MADNRDEVRNRFLSGWQARFNHHEENDRQSEIHERHLGIGIAWGAALGVAIGAGFGVALGNLAWGIGIGIAIGAGMGIALGAAWGSRHAQASLGSSHTDADEGI